jgi:hypothetical protein
MGADDKSSRFFTALFAMADMSLTLTSFGITDAACIRRGQDMLERSRAPPSCVD